MKTKLFSFLFVLLFSIMNAQINVSESFESGTLPTGWTSNGFASTNTASCTGTNSMVKLLGASSNNGAIYTSNYVSDGRPIAVSFNFKKQSGQTFAGYVGLYFVTNNDGNWQVISTNSSVGNNCQSIYGTIPSSSIPSGTNLTLIMYVYRTSGGSNIYFDDFYAKTVVNSSTEYTFNNTYANTLGSNPFSSSTYTSFVADRNGNAQSALQVFGYSTSTGSSASIPFDLLPYANFSRTISFWYKTNSNYNSPGVFSYGAGANSQTFGMYLNATGGPVFQAWGNDTDFGGTYAINTWQHVVISYDGSVVKMYKNGAYVSSATKNLNTVLSAFKLGNNATTVAYDDLKIYNYVISDADVASLYANNTLSTSEFNQNNLEAALYPNPVKNVLNITTSQTVKSVEIYNLQGQKVMVSDQSKIDLSVLNPGVYLVRIEDENSAVTTKRIIKS